MKNTILNLFFFLDIVLTKDCEQCYCVAYHLGVNAYDITGYKTCSIHSDINCLLFLMAVSFIHTHKHTDTHIYTYVYKHVV